MSPQNTTPELSDDDRAGSSVGSSRTMGGASRRRSTRACDQCRRTKSKCEPSELDNVCRACATLGISCTYVGPSHKRGPPKGYILALERRLHQVEALLGTIIGADDMRARSLVEDLSRDQLAAHIIRRVKVGPFGPRGRLQQPFGSTKEDFLAAIMTGPGDDSPRSHYQEDLALISPDRDWQDRLQTLLTSRRNNMTYNTQTPGSYTLPSFRQLSSPTPPQHQSQSQNQHIPQNALPVSFTAKVESPVSTSALLPPVSYPAQAPAGYGRYSWDGTSYGGLQRNYNADDAAQESKSNYELGPAAPNGQMNGRDSYQTIQQRFQPPAAEQPRWYFAPEAAG
ncbi:hypothetical protein EW026_g5896 [Hermanssonia centrifuga]|uniref:Zn(2)-C6 fungal-type domain-containing protein n=1 Tax=Hermanssonia centrifuga TaxID=98765 RepID=A0A4S4KH31_9APHY|nr:hypothetical protein EW026_g5896 [Hermanssonia centrifuga]